MSGHRKATWASLRWPLQREHILVRFLPGLGALLPRPAQPKRNFAIVGHPWFSQTYLDLEKEAICGTQGRDKREISRLYCITNMSFKIDGVGGMDKSWSFCLTFPKYAIWTSPVALQMINHCAVYPSCAGKVHDSQVEVQLELVKCHTEWF